jgi:hypothetical protein
VAAGCGLDHGGAEAFVLKLAQYAREHEPRRTVRLFCPPGTEIAARARSAAIPMEPAHFPLSPRSPLAVTGAVLATRRLLAAAGPDVIVVANDVWTHAYVSAAGALLRHRPPIVLIAHEQEPAARPAFRFVYRRFGTLVTSGANTAAAYQRALPGLEVRYVNNFRDFSH